MEDDEYEWLDAKAARNWRDHGITFVQAKAVFRDGYAVEYLDDRDGYDEERINRIGSFGGIILHVTYTMRGVRKRIISARRAEPYEADLYYTRNEF
jgi:uncharacterized DUF497 family protein